MSNSPTKVLLVSTVPSTLWAFFRNLPAYAKQNHFEISVAASQGPELAYFQQQFGVTTHAINLTRKISPLADVQAVIQLSRIIKQAKYDIVHAHTPKAGLVGMLAAKLAGVRHRIYTIHGFPAETATGLTRKLLLLSERTAASTATSVLVVSDSLREQIRSMRVVDDRKVQMLGDGTACGVDLERFTRTPSIIEQASNKRASLGIEPDALVMGFVGRLVHDKGIDVAVSAFLKLSETRSDLHLLLLGDYEPDRGRVSQHTIEQIDSHPRIKHVPFDWDPIPYYAAMDVLVLPTLREGFPYALLEAAALEVPAVATRATGCVDAIVDGKTGFLVDIADVSSLSQSVGSLLDNPALRKTQGKAARERVVHQFSSERLLKAHIKLYETMTEYIQA